MFDRNLMELSGMRGVLGTLVVLALLQAAAIVGQAWALSSAISSLWEGAALGEATPHIAAFFTCFALLQLLRFGQETMLDRYSRSRAEALREALLERVFDEHTLLGKRVGSTRIATAATDGINEVQAYLRIIPPKIVGMAAVSAPILVFEFAIDWPSGIILAVMFPVIVFFMVLLGRQARDRSERQYASYTRLANRFMDTLHGMRAITSFDAGDREAEAVHERSEALRVATVKTLSTGTLSSAVLDLCATFGVAAVAMMLAFRLLDGSLPLFTGLFALILAPEYFSPIRSFASDYHASLDGRNSLSTVLGLVKGAPADDGEPDPQGMREENGAPRVAFNGVSYAYDQAGSGVGPIDFNAEGPQKIAIIGASGAGKSTFANLAAGIAEPTSGSVNVSSVRYIPQHPHIFQTTLEDNMRFYNPSATRGEVESVAEAVGLGELVSELPQGLDTPVGEGARGLSGGEAHRVALARILLDHSARVLVFDEPTAHLDIETELDLKEPMLEAMQGRLVLLATHRLHWLSDMDRVVELESGRIVQDEVLS